MRSSLSLLLLLTQLAPASYSAVVVDATTSQPLAGVRVQATEPPTGVVITDDQGRFTLATAARTLTLTRLGYAPLQLTLPADARLADTLRLLPQAYALPEVAVRPPQVRTLLSVPAGGAELGRTLYPGQAVALLLTRPADAPADQPCVLGMVHLWLRERPQQGRLRVRLVDVLPGPPDRPGTRDLLPTPAVFSLAQLTQARRGELVVDLTPYNLLLPAAGLAVVVECLPTDPADLGTTVSAAADGRGHTTVTLAGSPGQASRTYAGTDFPMLTARHGTGPGTWSYYPNRTGWTTRSAVAYTVRTEVTVLSY